MTNNRGLSGTGPVIHRFFFFNEYGLPFHSAGFTSVESTNRRPRTILVRPTTVPQPPIPNQRKVLFAVRGWLSRRLAEPADARRRTRSGQRCTRVFGEWALRTLTSATALCPARSVHSSVCEFSTSGTPPFLTLGLFKGQLSIFLLGRSSLG